MIKRTDTESLLDFLSAEVIRHIRARLLFAELAPQGHEVSANLIPGDVFVDVVYDGCSVKCADVDFDPMNSTGIGIRPQYPVLRQHQQVCVNAV